jgi:hypothetical protein
VGCGVGLKGTRRGKATIRGGEILYEHFTVFELFGVGWEHNIIVQNIYGNTSKQAPFGE